MGSENPAIHDRQKKYYQSRTLEDRNPANSSRQNEQPQGIVPAPLDRSQKRWLRSSSQHDRSRENRLSYQDSAPPDNIDERDSDDPLCVTDYVMEMYEHLRSKENSTSVRPIYMENQPHINERMRSILVDWLVEVHLKFKLVPETLYLTINLIDRYLQRVSNFSQICIFNLLDQNELTD